MNALRAENAEFSASQHWAANIPHGAVRASTPVLAAARPAAKLPVGHLERQAPCGAANQAARLRPLQAFDLQAGRPHDTGASRLLPSGVCPPASETRNAAPAELPQPTTADLPWRRAAPPLRPAGATPPTLPSWQVASAPTRRSTSGCAPPGTGRQAQGSARCRRSCCLYFGKVGAAQEQRVRRGGTPRYRWCHQSQNCSSWRCRRACRAPYWRSSPDRTPGPGCPG